MKTLLAIVALALANAGCARFSTVQKDARYEGGELATEVTTKASAYTFFQSKSELANWKAKQTEAGQGAEVGSLSQEASTDLAKLLEAMTALANAIKP